MFAYAELLTRRPLAILGLVMIVSAGAATQLPRLANDDDVVRFLPAEDAEVQAFNAITKRFGAMEVALVAVEATGPADGVTLYTAAGLGYLRELTRRLARLPEVAHVTSLSELAIVERTDEGAAQVALVPPDIPSDATALKAIEQRVLGLDYLTGLLASADGTAAVLVAQLRTSLPDGTFIGAKRAAETVKAAAAELAMPAGVQLHFGGAPFIAEAAASGSQADMVSLGPLVAAVALLVLLLSFRSFWAALYTVLTAGLAILWTLGLMGALGQPLTLVSSSLPVILVALGSLYAVHLLVWYRTHDADLRGTIVNVGWPIVVTALTTIAGFVSFLVMDVAPMRELGLQMAIGSAIAALLALTFLPSLLVLKPLAPRPAAQARVERWLVALGHTCRRRRWLVLVTAGTATVLLATQIPNVEARMDTAGFFAPDSAPARADALLAGKFGGSVFLQVLVDADIGNPAVLHRLAAFEDRLAAVPGVVRPQSIADVLAVVHEGLKGDRRLSRSHDEIEQLGYLAAKTDPSVSLLVDKDWRGALIQVGLGGSDADAIARVTPTVRDLAARHLTGHAAAVQRSSERAPLVFRDAAERIAAIARVPDRVAQLEATLAAPIPASAGASIAKAVRDVIQAEIVDNEMVALTDPARAPDLARVVSDDALGLRLDRARFDALLRGYLAPSELEDAEELDRSAGYLFTQLELAIAPALRRYLVAAILTVTGPLDAHRGLRVAAIADEVLQPRWYVAVPSASDVARPISVVVSGQPVIQQAMAQSVERNQTRWMLISLPLVLLILGLVFRSVAAALIGIVPAGLALLVTFGLMGLFPDRLPMDIGASMLASIALGVGIDYAIHFLWRYQRSDLDLAMRTTGRSITINALEITGGFGVLAFASIAPVSRFGLLTAETLLVAAVATLVLLPALLAWWNPRRPPPFRHEPMEN